MPTVILYGRWYDPAQDRFAIRSLPITFLCIAELMPIRYLISYWKSLVTRSDIPMRLSKEALSIKVVVRRARRGATPFIWEINRDSMVEPVYVSPDAFVSMEAAFKAGQARLAEFVPSRRAMAEIADYHA
jgi:hypothetical protein